MTNPTTLRRRGPPVRIDTPRFVLASLTARRAPLVAEWLNGTRVSAALGEVPAALSTARVARYLADFDRIDGHAIGIHDRATAKAVGFYTVTIDPPHGTATLTTVIGDETALRKGAATEAALALLKWLFETVRITKLCARVAEINTASVAWLTPLIPLEGRLRDQIRLPDGARTTVLVYGLLADEWPSLRERVAATLAARLS